MKEHVGLGYDVCPVCLKEHNEVVLMQTRLGAPPKLNHHNFTGWSMCPEHQKMKDDGFIAMVVVTNETAPTLENAQRTGDIVHIKAEAWPKVFNTPVPEKGLAFIDVDAFEKLKAINKESESADDQ